MLRNLFFIGIILVSANAFAADSTHRTCTGLKNITVRYDDVRAPNGFNRIISLQMETSNKTYRDELETSDEVIAVKVVNVNDESDVIFEGTVQAIRAKGLALKGKLQTGSKTAINTVLKCTEIQ